MVKHQHWPVLCSVSLLGFVSWYDSIHSQLSLVNLLSPRPMLTDKPNLGLCPVIIMQFRIQGALTGEKAKEQVSTS